jgi:hypothetical protein
MGMRWARYVACMGKISAYDILVGNPERKNHSEDLGVNGKMILKPIFGKQGGKVWTRCIWLRIGTSGGIL